MAPCSTQGTRGSADRLASGVDLRRLWRATLKGLSEARVAEQTIAANFWHCHTVQRPAQFLLLAPAGELLNALRRIWDERHERGGHAIGRLGKKVCSQTVGFALQFSAPGIIRTLELFLPSSSAKGNSLISLENSGYSDTERFD